MFTWMSAFSAGVIILYCSGFLLPWYAYIFALLVVLFIPDKSLRRVCSIWVIFLILGHIYASNEAQKHLNSILPAKFEGVSLQVNGYFCTLPRKSMHSDQAEFCAEAMFHPDTKEKILGESRLSLRWPKKLSARFEDPAIRYFLNVKLKRPRGTLNAVGNSYEQYLFQKRIVATGVVSSVFAVENYPNFSVSRGVIQSVNYTRKRISNFLEGQLESLEHKGLLKALLLGERSAITKQDNDILSRTGTQHLMAISGLHIGVLLMLLYHIFPKTPIAVLVILVLGLLYIALVGFSASSQRAWIMCVIAIVYLMGFKRPSLWRPFVASLTVVLLLDPLAPLGMGFWFSFVSVGLLLLFSFIGPKNSTVWALIIFVQLVFLVGLAPLNSYFGLPHSLSNSLANIIAIPWISTVVLPGALISLIVSILLPDFSVHLFDILNEILHVLMTFLSSLQVVTAQLKATDSLIISFALYVVLFFSVLFYRLKLLLACLVFTLILYFSVPSNIKNGSNQLVVFDAGQGLALGVRTDAMVWLYDTGAAYEKSSVAQRAILPYLRANNLTELTKGVIISHADWDHAGGLSDVLSEVEVDYLWSGEVERLGRVRDQMATPCVESMHWHSSKLKIEVLYPFKKTLESKRKSSNNHSCVIRVTLSGFTFLLMGDLEAEAELELVRYYRQALKSDVLIAGHHGASKASSYALLKHVQPDYVVFSAGYKNRFGHPHSKVIQRAQFFTQKIYNTAVSGALTFTVASAKTTDSAEFKMSVVGVREGKLPFWIVKEE